MKTCFLEAAREARKTRLESHCLMHQDIGVQRRFSKLSGHLTTGDAKRAAAGKAVG
jgi:hypothetical protein